MYLTKLIPRHLVFNEKIFAAIIGNFLTYFEFSVYLFLVPKLSKLFFDPINSYGRSLALSTFSIAFIARPIGGYLLGKIGDQNKEKALYLAIFISGFCTMIIGFIPSFSSIGLFSPLILFLCRLAQSFSLGGEFCSSLLYVYNLASNNKKTLYISLLISSGTLGWGTGAWIVTLEFINKYVCGWRLLFIFIGLLGILGSMWSYKLSKKNIYSVDHQKKEYHLSQKYYGISTFLFSGLNGCLFYSFLIFPKIFIADSIKTEDLGILKWLSVFAMFSYAFSLIIIGYTIKIKKYFYFFYKFTLLLIIFIFPFYLCIFSKNPIAIFMVTFLGSIFTAIITVISNIVICKDFYPFLNVSGVSLFYNLGSCLIGGTTPTILSLIIDINKNAFLTSSYVITYIIIILFFLSSLLKKNAIQ
ncbi:MAG: Proline/betaine transporter [Holosporales bacterium]